jgi:hypothetical protein
VPFFTPSLIALSAKSNPYALPIATEFNLLLVYLLNCYILKLGSNPGALDNKIGYLDLIERIAFFKSIV